MRIYDIIKRKRDGCELTAEEIVFLTKKVTDGGATDEQVGAFLMAVCLNGMTTAETVELTNAMAKSGDMLNLRRFGRQCADKHSSGGVGDKTTLIVAPLVAACGVRVAKMSGRGLGFTGGTIDKLESVPGFQTDLSEEEFFSIVEKTGIAVVAQTKNLAPCDKRFYAARDLTATVDSLPLIVSSIMSKKLAAGAPNIVLDVKTGCGAFARTPEYAEALAREMVDLAKSSGRRATALISDMNEPLGYAVGNALEVMEAVETLRGGGDKRLSELCEALASEMVSLAEDMPVESAEKKVRQVLESGAALEKFREWIAAQGGDIRVVNEPRLLCRARHSRRITAESDGFVSVVDAEKIGLASLALGAGRVKREGKIDLSAGIVLLKKTGDPVKQGEDTAILYADDENLLASAAQTVSAAFGISALTPTLRPIIIRRIK